MAYELINTSAPKGLKPGTSGFCTVAYTAGMAPNYINVLESLSAYKLAFPAYHENASLNPVVYSYKTYSIGGSIIFILSRICFAGFDYTKRSNKLAHHLVLKDNELISCGPAAIFYNAPDLFLKEWNHEPKLLNTEKTIPAISSDITVAEAWSAVSGGEAGWAGFMAEYSTKNPNKHIYIVYNPGTEILPLINEAMMHIPEMNRWDITFNTYVYTLPRGVDCKWRCCLPDSPILKEARRTNSPIINLTKINTFDFTEFCLQFGIESNSDFIHAARTGVLVSIHDVESSSVEQSPQSRTLSKGKQGINTQQAKPQLLKNDNYKKELHVLRQRESKQPTNFYSKSYNNTRNVPPRTKRFEKENSISKFKWIIASAIVFLLLLLLPIMIYNNLSDVDNPEVSENNQTTENDNRNFKDNSSIDLKDENASFKNHVKKEDSITKETLISQDIEKKFKERETKILAEKKAKEKAEKEKLEAEKRKQDKIAKQKVEEELKKQETSRKLEQEEKKRIEKLERSAFYFWEKWQEAIKKNNIDDKSKDFFEFKIKGIDGLKKGDKITIFVKNKEKWNKILSFDFSKNDKSKTWILAAKYRIVDQESSAKPKEFIQFEIVKDGVLSVKRNDLTKENENKCKIIFNIKDIEHLKIAGHEFYTNFKPGKNRYSQKIGDNVELHYKNNKKYDGLLKVNFTNKDYETNFHYKLALFFKNKRFIPKKKFNSDKSIISKSIPVKDYESLLGQNKDYKNLIQKKKQLKGKLKSIKELIKCFKQEVEANNDDTIPTDKDKIKKLNAKYKNKKNIAQLLKKLLDYSGKKWSELKVEQKTLKTNLANNGKAREKCINNLINEKKILYEIKCYKKDKKGKSHLAKIIKPVTRKN